MTTYTHVTASTQLLEAKGVRYAYRRFGAETGTPLVFLQHFRGGMDNWDPLVTDGLSKGRPVILVNYAGVASSGGEPAQTVDGMADGIADFINALNLPSAVDVLGFSIGGFVAQSLAYRYPQLVRKLVLVGTGPRGGEPANDPKIPQVAGNPVPGEEDFLFLFFSSSEKSQAAGRAFWQRRHQRLDQDLPSSVDALKAQVAAITEWGAPLDDDFAYLKEIMQPTLVVNGHTDIMVPTINAFTLQQYIPNAQLILYPDSGHGSQFQYPLQFVQQTALFLDPPAEPA
ncbi:alpha/beta fold hydrolase [Massilia dura]|uniref:Alpha/beta fold hydrolase n=1 Tax=Pseudoduganella dura TaxID=321982 RepID=A0A6I3XIN5_9BURK|nr:alpha/beta hydrolase [Pseudoduganella dura]MUI15366.1 alpha/beta fold hydrolase [Pseudoduganella dura]GGX80469.1 peroxidase [Pseudoduganella dura]